jgi:hypothetical protein
MKTSDGCVMSRRKPGRCDVLDGEAFDEVAA